MARTAPASCTDPKCVSFTHVTAGDTLFKAVRNAMNWFADAYWRERGPDPILSKRRSRATNAPGLSPRRVLEWRTYQAA